jgi:hypothetical protein
VNHAVTFRSLLVSWESLSTRKVWPDVCKLTVALDNNQNFPYQSYTNCTRIITAVFWCSEVVASSL